MLRAKAKVRVDYEKFYHLIKGLSRRRDSNPRPPAYKAGDMCKVVSDSYEWLGT